MKYLYPASNTVEDGIVICCDENNNRYIGKKIKDPKLPLDVVLLDISKSDDIDNIICTVVVDNFGKVLSYNEKLH